MFGVMLLFLPLWFLHCPFVSSQTQLSKTTVDILKDGSMLNISLYNYDGNSMAGKVLDTSKILLPLSTTTINIVQIPPSLSFLVVQAHSFVYNITLSHNEFPTQNSYASGTNIGLVQLVPKQDTAQFFLLNENPANNVSVLVAVQGYGRDAPVPGGCNMEFPVETAPYLGVGYNSSLVWVDVPLPAAPAATPQVCEKQSVEVVLYHSYLPEGDYSTETYFETLRGMMSVQDVRSNAKKVDFALQGSHMRRFFSAYTGTGSVYGVIAVAGFSGAAYVPAITYACNIVSETERCVILSTTFSKVLCAVTLFLGFFICFFGHRFFMTTVFLLGCLAGCLATYIIIDLQESDNPNKILYSVLAGLAVGIVFLMLWCWWGIPILSILPALLILGYIVAAVVMFCGVGDYPIFESDANYWILFICVALSIPILLVTNSRMANILCCSVLGAFAVIVPIDHYIGSNLKFILLNTSRRATVKRFNLAVIDPPFQTQDLLLSAAWFGLACLGMVFQWIQSRGKPPFPNVRNVGENDRTSLLTSSHPNYGYSLPGNNYLGWDD